MYANSVSFRVVRCAGVASSIAVRDASANVRGALSQHSSQTRFVHLCCSSRIGMRIGMHCPHKGGLEKRGKKSKLWMRRQVYVTGTEVRSPRAPCRLPHQHTHQHTYHLHTVPVLAWLLRRFQGVRHSHKLHPESVLGTLITSHAQRAHTPLRAIQGLRIGALVAYAG